MASLYESDLPPGSKLAFGGDPPWCQDALLDHPGSGFRTSLFHGSQPWTPSLAMKRIKNSPHPLGLVIRALPGNMSLG